MIGQRRALPATTDRKPRPPVVQHGSRQPMGWTVLALRLGAARAARRSATRPSLIRPQPDRRSELRLTPLELIEPLAALIPRPRLHRHGHRGASTQWAIAPADDAQTSSLYPSFGCCCLRRAYQSPTNPTAAFGKNPAWPDRKWPVRACCVTNAIALRGIHSSIPARYAQTFQYHLAAESKSNTRALAGSACVETPPGYGAMAESRQPWLFAALALLPLPLPLLPGPVPFWPFCRPLPLIWPFALLLAPFPLPLLPGPVPFWPFCWPLLFALPLVAGATDGGAALEPSAGALAPVEGTTDPSLDPSAEAPLLLAPLPFPLPLLPGPVPFWPFCWPLLRALPLPLLAGATDGGVALEPSAGALDPVEGATDPVLEPSAEAPGTAEGRTDCGAALEPAAEALGTAVGGYSGPGRPARDPLRLTQTVRSLPLS